MQQLGYRHLSWDRHLFHAFEAGDYATLIRAARHYDSFDDLPWCEFDMVKRLDEAYPGSKFVLLTRDSESWARSYVRHQEQRGTRYDLERDIDYMLQHDRDIREYFSGSGQLLEMNIFDHEGYDKLAPFLFGEFPHSNKTSETRKIVNIASTQRVA